eukprot:scpid110127/ scgid18202/ 
MCAKRISHAQYSALVRLVCCVASVSALQQPMSLVYCASVVPDNVKFAFEHVARCNQGAVTRYVDSQLLAPVVLNVYTPNSRGTAGGIFSAHQKLLTLPSSTNSSIDCTRQRELGINGVQLVL